MYVIGNSDESCAKSTFIVVKVTGLTSYIFFQIADIYNVTDVNPVSLVP